MNILMTGTTGFVGKNLGPYLQQKQHHIQALSLKNEDWQNHISADAEVYIHLAGKAHDLKNTSDELEYFLVNTELTKEFVNSFINSNAKIFIFMSTIAAVNEFQVEGILTEDAKCIPSTAYGKSKRMAEEYLLNLKLPKNKSIIILRPAMIHGPGNKGNLNLLYSIVSKGIPYPLLAFENKRSFLSVGNLCFIVSEILQNHPVISGIFNIVDDEPLSTNEVVFCIQDILFNKRRTIKIPKSIIKAMAKIGDALHLPLNTERLTKLTENYVVSNAKIKNALQISTLPLSATEGLKITIKSFKK